MTDLLSTMPIRIECLSPVHIGSGETLGSLDFVREGGRVVVVDRGKLLKRVGTTSTLSDAYVRLCESERPNLGDFLRSMRMSASDFAAYAVTVSGSVGWDILAFIKMANWNVYFPGSSLKGAIRSVLLHRIVAEKEEVRQVISREAIDEIERLRRPVAGRRSAKLWQTSAVADRSAFGKDHNHSVMRVLHLTDSRPIPASRLTVAEVGVLTVRSGNLVPKEGRSGRPMRLTVEVLPAGVCLESRLTWNGYLGDGHGPAATLGFADRAAFVADWLKHCNVVARDALQREVRFSREYGASELAKWHEDLLGRLDRLQANQCFLHMAWGAGFNAMAVTNLFDSADRRIIRTGANLGLIGRDGPVDPFPKSRKVVLYQNGRQEPLGWIMLTVGGVGK